MMMCLLPVIQLQDVGCGILLLLVIIIFSIFMYFFGKNYMNKSNSYYKNLYQRAVDKTLKKEERKDK